MKNKLSSMPTSIWTKSFIFNSQILFAWVITKIGQLAFDNSTRLILEASSLEFETLYENKD